MWQRLWHFKYSLVVKCLPHTSHLKRRSPIKKTNEHVPLLITQWGFPLGFPLVFCLLMNSPKINCGQNNGASYALPLERILGNQFKHLPVCVLLWLLSFPLSAKQDPHSSQIYGFSPVWDLHSETYENIKKPFTTS